MSRSVRILLACPDRPGIIKAVSGELAFQQANITDLDQHSSEGELLMRLVCSYDGDPRPLQDALVNLAERELEGEIRLSWPRARRCVIFASSEDHCLADLLWRSSVGELGIEITRVVANSDAPRELVDRFGVPFERIEFSDPSDQAAAERHQLEILRVDATELLILARYMRILSPEMLEELRGMNAQAINIHHSFLPAFAGAGAYQRAFERGVKVIGATAHYVTEELDEGPIITQEVAPVSHRDEVDDLIRIGRDTERLALAAAVRAHTEDRVIVRGGRAIVF